MAVKALKNFIAGVLIVGFTLAFLATFAFLLQAR